MSLFAKRILLSPSTPFYGCRKSIKNYAMKVLPSCLFFVCLWDLVGLNYTKFRLEICPVPCMVHAYWFDLAAWHSPFRPISKVQVKQRDSPVIWLCCNAGAMIPQAGLPESGGHLWLETKRIRDTPWTNCSLNSRSRQHFCQRLLPNWFGHVHFAAMRL